MEDPKIEEARDYTKTELMKLGKPELLAVAGEIGVDLVILPKFTKEAISDAIIVFLEPHLDHELVEMSPVAKDFELEEDETIEPRVLEPELATVEDEEVKRDKAIQSAPKHVAIQSCWPARITVRDNPSGHTYIWKNAGITIMVAKEDEARIMSMNRSGTRGCCGSGGDRIYFVLA